MNRIRLTWKHRTIENPRICKGEWLPFGDLPQTLLDAWIKSENNYYPNYEHSLEVETGTKQ